MRSDLHNNVIHAFARRYSRYWFVAIIYLNFTDNGCVMNSHKFSIIRNQYGIGKQ